MREFRDQTQTKWTPEKLKNSSQVEKEVIIIDAEFIKTMLNEFREFGGQSMAISKKNSDRLCQLLEDYYDVMLKAANEFEDRQGHRIKTLEELHELIGKSEANLRREVAENQKGIEELIREVDNWKQNHSNLEARLTEALNENSRLRSQIRDLTHKEN